MSDDSKGSGLSGTEVVLVVVGVLVVLWFVSGIIGAVVGFAWTLAKIALGVVVVVLLARFLVGRSKSS